MPKALARKPVLKPRLAIVYEAFNALCNDRQIGAFGGVSGISFASIDRYAARLGIEDASEFATFHEMIRRLDAVYIASVGKQD